MCSDYDRLTLGGDKCIPGLVPVAEDQPEIINRDDGYFLRGEMGEVIASRIFEFMALTLIGSSITDQDYSGASYGY